MNVVAYCRVSTDKSDQLNSLETQKEFFQSYCRRNHLSLIHTYADEGISGTKTKNRTEFLRMMCDADKGLFEQVIVKDVSRLARNTVDLLQSVRKLKSLNIETVFITSDMKSMGNSEFVLTLMGAMAQEESSNISKRVKFGKRENAKKGRVPNIVYGYDKIPGNYFNLKINPDESKIIKQIFDWYTKEGYGANKIANMLNARGLKTKRYCQWSQNAISRILKNEIYVGKIVNGKEEVSDFLTGTRKEHDKEDWLITDKPELAIIEEKQFKEAQNILAGRSVSFKINKERQSNRYLFSTLIRCEECGYSFRRMERKYKNTYVSWVCSGRNSNGTASCDNKVKIPEEDLKKAIKKFLLGILFQKDKIIKNIVSEFNRINKKKENDATLKKELRVEISKLIKNKEKYTQMFLDDLISRDELKEKVGKLNEKLEKNNNELKMMSYNMSAGEQLENLIGETFDGIGEIFEKAEITNAQLKKVIKQIIVKKDGIIDVYLRPFNEIELDYKVGKTK